jgi:hypothetical protein
MQQPRTASSANVLERLFLHEERRGDVLQHSAIHLDDLFKSPTIRGNTLQTELQGLLGQNLLAASTSTAQ